MVDTKAFLNEIMNEVASDKGISREQLEKQVAIGNCRRPECNRRAIKGHWYCYPHLPKSTAGRKLYKEAKKSEIQSGCRRVNGSPLVLETSA